MMFCAYACAYVDPILASQSYDISISIYKHMYKKNEHVRSSCAYAYAYVAGVLTCLHMCLSLCTNANQALTRATWEVIALTAALQASDL